MACQYLQSFQLNWRDSHRFLKNEGKRRSASLSWSRMAGSTPQELEQVYALTAMFSCTQRVVSGRKSKAHSQKVRIPPEMAWLYESRCYLGLSCIGKPTTRWNNHKQLSLNQSGTLRAFETSCGLPFHPEGPRRGRPGANKCPRGGPRGGDPNLFWQAPEDVPEDSKTPDWKTVAGARINAFKICALPHIKLSERRECLPLSRAAHGTLASTPRHPRAMHDMYRMSRCTARSCSAMHTILEWQHIISVVQSGSPLKGLHAATTRLKHSCIGEIGTGTSFTKAGTAFP